MNMIRERKSRLLLQFHITGRCNHRRKHCCRVERDSERIVPIGNGCDMEKLAISTDNIEKYIGLLKKAQGNKLIKILHPKTKVTMDRALQFLYSDGDI